MKRLIALMLTVCVLLTCSVTAWADSSIFTISAEDCAPGATIQVAFGLKENSGVSAANFEVTYDTDTFEYVSYEDGDLISNCLAVGNGVDGKFLYALATTNPLTAAGTLFTLEFTVDSGATGDHPFYFYATTCADENGDDIKAETASATITVAGESVSDVSVTPVTSITADGSAVTVSADNGESVQGTVNGNDSGEGEASVVMGWIIAIVVVLAVAGVALLIILAIRRAHKNDQQQETEHQSILDEDAKALLDMTPDSLEDESKDE